ncbi:putative phage holin [Allonocardiopsis opalescens]|uniref:Uncharacterized protein n=1 Tax=Allonocardiopsis opalescens TaxID=1144618 RepID=A0A2T0PVK4_9ACTN|nr:hypothetical protein [Allonocardiopsis opalescens]PRX95559.1 hypothetical protein CLV72_109168 [Allonocardiopsis opalescens]
MLHLAGDLLVHTTTVLALACVIWHGLTARWWESEAGRHVMSFMASLAAVLVWVSIRNLIGEFPGYEVIRLILFATVPAVFAHRLYLLVKRWRLQRQRHLDTPGDGP